MDRTHWHGRRGAARAPGAAAELREHAEEILLEGVSFRSGHGLLKSCDATESWRNDGAPCGAPEWTPKVHHPVSHTLGEAVELELTLKSANGRGRAAAPDVYGDGPEGLHFSRRRRVAAHTGRIEVRSRGNLARRVERLLLDVHWSDGTRGSLSPDHTENVVYTTLGRPRDDQQEVWAEDGVTLKRMDRAVAWVSPLRTLEPHAIVKALMSRFPYYALRPSPKVPRRYHHPTYFNDEGGAWPMSDYVEESGECQAIVRLVRGMLRQLGMPGEARAVLVWGDPEVDGGKKPISAYWDENPGAGLDRVKVVEGRAWFAALVDSPVEVGKVYPPSHTPLESGPSPGLNRFEACLEFNDGKTTLDYGGGAGVFESRDEVLHAFWGLIWASAVDDQGFRVEQIVARYREAST